MAILPGTRKSDLEFFEQHIAAWQLTPTAIGLTAAQLTAFATQITVARKGFNDAELARNASKAATTSWYGVNDPMVATGRDLIRTIKAYAEAAANPNAIYAIAQIPPPADPTPGQAPATPTNLNATISTAGELTLRWDATPAGAASGIFFLVARKNAGEGAFTTLAGTAEKMFTDSGFVGTNGVVEYRIQAVRGNLVSDWTDMIAIDLGGGTGFVAEQGLKMAA